MCLKSRSLAFMAKLDFCRWKFLRQRISRLPLGLDVGFRTNSLLLDSLFCLVFFFLHILVFLVLKVCVSAELAPLPSLQEPAVPLPLSISCSERGLPTLWGPEDSNWFLLFVFFGSFCLCFSPFYSFRFIPAQILLPQQSCPPSHGRSTRSSSSGDCSWTDCKSSGRLPSYSERFTLEFLTLTIKDSLHRSWIVCT